MQKIAKLAISDRQELFRNTAQKMHVRDAIIEKDFWVCYTLDYLFHRSPWQNNFTFKGGTSLSKAYNLIERFSEDIDLILDWQLLGYEKNEPWLERNKTQQDKFNKEANKKAEEFLLNEFCPKIKEAFSSEINGNIEITVDELDKQTIIFSYPVIFSNDSILEQIRLEIGALAAWTPSEEIKIKPYASHYYPFVFSSPATTVLTVKPERTFWEKITILHQEANRSESKQMKPRYFRHYYDIYRMLSTSVKESAFNNLDLLNKVVEFKKKFYPVNWAKYDEAAPGTLKLFPPDYRLAELRKDYIAMKDMFYGEIPNFDDVMESIRLLEAEINRL